MLWSSTDIRHGLQKGTISIDGMVDGSMQPASVDFHLSDSHLMVWKADPTRAHDPEVIDPFADNTGRMVKVPFTHYDDVGWAVRLLPHQFALASTSERVRFGERVAGRLEGKSSLARLGLMPHAAAGFFDPGFEGWPTLELVNLTPLAILLRPGMAIAQMSFFSMVSAPEHLYGETGSKYQQQSAEPQPSLYHLNTTGAP